MLAVLAATFLCGCFGAPRYEGARSDHFDGHDFHNEAPFESRSVGDLLRWQLQGGAIDWPDWVDVPRAPRPAARVDHGVRVTFVNHATVLVQLGGMNILTDPVWSDRVGPLSWLGPARHKAPGIVFDELPRIDLVVLSHNHYDHLDLPTLRKLVARDHPRILAGLGTHALLTDNGIDGSEDLDWWQSREMGGVRVTFAPAQHWSRRGLTDSFAELWGSFYFAARDVRVYFAGDTAWGPHFAQVRERLGPPTLALLPIGAYLPRWFMHSQHVDPEDAVLAHIALGATQSVAIHWGTFDQSDEGMYEPAGELLLALRRQGLPPSSFVALENGESVQIEGRAPAPSY